MNILNFNYIMKNATVSFTHNGKKDETITGKHLTLEEEGSFIKILDGDTTVLAVHLNQIVFIKLSK
jgi:hypothetical protein